MWAGFIEEATEVLRWAYRELLPSDAGQEGGMVLVAFYLSFICVVVEVSLSTFLIISSEPRILTFAHFHWIFQIIVFLFCYNTPSLPHLASTYTLPLIRRPFTLLRESIYLVVWALHVLSHEFQLSPLEINDYPLLLIELFMLVVYFLLDLALLDPTEPEVLFGQPHVLFLLDVVHHCVLSC